MLLKMSVIYIVIGLQNSFDNKLLFRKMLIPNLGCLGGFIDAEDDVCFFLFLSERERVP